MASSHPGRRFFHELPAICVFPAPGLPRVRLRPARGGRRVVHRRSPAVPPRPVAEAEAVTARIDDPEDGPTEVEAQWQVVPNYQDAEEGEAVWTFKAPDQEALDKALQLTREAIEHAEGMTHVGFLTLPDRSVFPRIVGAKGSTVARLRAESQADITVGRQDSTIVIIGKYS